MNMVEKVARALCDDTLSRWRSPIALKDEPWREFIPAARAAIEAMRLPTDEMTDAIWEETGDPCWRENAIKAWQAGIDEALK